MKVSIIIPLHNCGNFIEETIYSCLDQTYRNIEIIVVENGSTDNSLEKAKQFESDKLRVITIPEGNASRARNAGLDLATGDLIQFLDADDILSPGKIEHQVILLQKHPEGFVSSCGWGKFRDDIREAKFVEQPVWRIREPIDWLVRSWNGEGMMVDSGWLVPRSIIEKSGYWNESLTLHDDGEFFCRVLLASHGNIFCDEAKVYYRQTETSLSRKNRSREAAESAFKVYSSYHENSLKFENSVKVRSALAMNYARFLYEYHPEFPDLLDQARAGIKKLGFREIPLLGGKFFQKLAGMTGFENALKFRSLLQKFRSPMM